jgi:hypothetical protein
LCSTREDARLQGEIRWEECHEIRQNSGKDRPGPEGFREVARAAYHPAAMKHERGGKKNRMEGRRREDEEKPHFGDGIRDDACIACRMLLGI